MDRTGFLKLLSLSFFPELRELGFKGSGATLRRIQGQMVHVLNVQGSSGAERFYVNLGVTLGFLGMNGIHSSNLHETKESSCPFHKRLDPPESPGNGWAYGASEEEARRQLQRLAAQWRTEGLSWFAQFQTFPDSFTVLVAAPVSDQTSSLQLLVLAKTALQIGNRDRANHLAQAAGTDRVRARLERPACLS